MQSPHPVVTALGLVLALLLPACCGPGQLPAPPSASSPASQETNATPPPSETTMPSLPAPSDPAATGLATFGAGCYWCTEAVLERLPGVLDVRSGFMGGTVANPTYEQVCSHTTGHIEVAQVTFDPRQVSYDQLLDWFWQLHDPTSMDRQGGDEGEPYRSVIFYHDEAQRLAAEAAKLRAQAGLPSPIVTEIRAATAFYPAPAEHQDYYRNNKSQGYCRIVIAPKLEKLEQHGLPKQAPK